MASSRHRGQSLAQFRGRAFRALQSDPREDLRGLWAPLSGETPPHLPEWHPRARGRLRQPSEARELHEPLPLRPTCARQARNRGRLWVPDGGLQDASPFPPLSCSLWRAERPLRVRLTLEFLRGLGLNHFILVMDPFTGIGGAPKQSLSSNAMNWTANHLLIQLQDEGPCMGNE